ncbi:DNA-methyltransferase [Streptomyces massasporeus]|uniref:DNA-methyltransferase n=1 Tax=Streptomyces massasporeus TaxID=67324 RepID=UPI003409CA67
MPFSLYQGDALSVLAGLPDGCVDSVITDPPYNSGGRTAKERTTRSAKQKYTSADAKNDLADFTGENMDQRSYGFWLTQIMTEAHRLTRTGGTALLFTDWRQLPTTTDAIQAAGWLWRGVLAWHKPQARPQKGRFTQNCEFIVWASKGAIDGSRNPVVVPSGADLEAREVDDGFEGAYRGLARQGGGVQVGGCMLVAHRAGNVPGAYVGGDQCGLVVDRGGRTRIVQSRRSVREFGQCVHALGQRETDGSRASDEREALG